MRRRLIFGLNLTFPGNYLKHFLNILMELILIGLFTIFEVNDNEMEIDF